MRGIVIAVNSVRGMVVVETDEGSYSAIELIGGYDVELGDILSGNLETEGAETIRNVSQSERMDAYVQGVYPTEEPAIEIIC